MAYVGSTCSYIADFFQNDCLGCVVLSILCTACLQAHTTIIDTIPHVRYSIYATIHFCIHTSHTSLPRNTKWCGKDNIADENNNSSISDDSTLIDNNANNIESTDPMGVTKDCRTTGVTKDRPTGVTKDTSTGVTKDYRPTAVTKDYRYVRKFNSEKHVLQRFNSKINTLSNSQINIGFMNILSITNKIYELNKFSEENEVLAVSNNSNFVKQLISLFNSQGNKVIVVYKPRLALHLLRVKEAQVYLRKAQVNLSGQTQEYTLSEVEISVQLWKMFFEKIGLSGYRFPLSEESDHTTSVPASVFPSLPRYCSDVMWCTVRGGNSKATATLKKVRTLFKQAVPKAKSLPLSYAKPLQQVPVPSAGGNLPHSDLAISAKSKAELKAQSNLNDHSLLTLFPRGKTSLKAFYQPTAPLSEASPSDLFTAVQDFLPSGATCGVLDSKDIPSGRQVPNHPQGRGQQGQGSYQGEQSKGAVSGNVQCSGGLGGLGGACGGGGGSGGDGDPPWNGRRSHYDEEVTEDEDEDDDPKPKPKGLDNEEETDNTGIRFMNGIPEQNTHGTDQCCPPKLSVPRVSRRDAFTGTCTVSPLFLRPVPTYRPVAHLVSTSATQQSPHSPAASPPTSSAPPSPTHSSDSGISNLERFDELVTGACMQHHDNAEGYDYSIPVGEETQPPSNLDQVQSTLIPFAAQSSENNGAAVPPDLVSAAGDSDDERNDVSREPEEDD